MFAFHLVWDLAQFGWIDRDAVFAPEFRWFGHAIAGSFLLLVGVSLVLARRSGPLWRSPHFWRRWGLIVSSAAAISAVSYWLFPETPIFFGILHCIALATLVALPLLGAPSAVLLGLGALGLLAPHFFASTAFDGKIFWWTGLSRFVPPSNDYAPLLPWAAFVLFGVALANILSSLAGGRGRKPDEGVLGKPGLLAFCGRHSLAFYLIHQPVLFGFFTALGLVAAPPPEAGAFLRECAVNCVNQGVEAGLCEKSCGCLIDHAKAQGFWEAMARDRMNAAQKGQAHDEAVSCYAEAAGK